MLRMSAAISIKCSSNLVHIMSVMTLKELHNSRVQVYVEVTVTDRADYFVLRVNECWATQSHQPNSTEGSVHHLLLNGFDHLSVFTVNL